MSTTITITSIGCIKKSDLDTHDEVWLYAQCDGGPGIRNPTSPLGIWPMSETPGTEKGDNTWNLDPQMVLTFDYCANLTLYEQDDKLSLSVTDFLGNVRFEAGNLPESPITVGNGDTASYSVTFTVS